MYCTKGTFHWHPWIKWKQNEFVLLEELNLPENITRLGLGLAPEKCVIGGAIHENDYWNMFWPGPICPGHGSQRVISFFNHTPHMEEKI